MQAIKAIDNYKGEKTPHGSLKSEAKEETAFGSQPFSIHSIWLTFLYDQFLVKPRIFWRKVQKLQKL